MPTIEITSQAYKIVEKQAQETKRSPAEVASDMITAQVASTEHPYIERRSGVLGGKPVIKGSRLAVWQVAERLKLGDSPDDLLEAYSYLSAAALFDAISYYYDHRAEIEQQITENQLENVLAKHNAVMDERGRITFLDLPSPPVDTEHV